MNVCGTLYDYFKKKPVFLFHLLCNTLCGCHYDLDNVPEYSTTHNNIC